MRKVAFFTFILISTFSLFMISRFGYCDNEPLKRKAAGQNLVNLDPTRSEDQVRDLTRRIDDLEREIHFQEDRIRNLERTVNDLRRGR